MTTRKVEISDYLLNLLRKVEIKRVEEKLTKMEVCKLYGLSYTFFMNCINGRGKPSKTMVDALEDYMKLPPAEAYKRIFDLRDKEDYYEKLEITDEDVKRTHEGLVLDKVWLRD